MPNPSRFYGFFYSVRSIRGWGLLVATSGDFLMAMYTFRRNLLGFSSSHMRQEMHTSTADCPASGFQSGSY